MQLKQLIQRLQSVLTSHGNIDVVIPHPNIEQGFTVGTPLFHLDVLTEQRPDNFVMVGIGSVNGLRPYVKELPVPMTFLRLSPYSMQRIQGLHDISIARPVSATVTPSAASNENESSNMPISPSETSSDETVSKSKNKKKNVKPRRKHKA